MGAAGEGFCARRPNGAVERMKDTWRGVEEGSGDWSLEPLMVAGKEETKTNIIKASNF